jgi:hypothetical protein
MSQINREGTFRGYAIEKGVAESKGGFPQFVVRFQGREFYDEDTEQWIDWSEYEENEIVGYFVLFGGNGEPTLTAAQIQKAFGWSGESFSELDEANYSETLVQFRTEYRTYQENTTLQVTWVDEANAEPGRKLRKLEKAEISKIDAKYAAALRKLSGGPKPKSVPSKPPVPKPETPPPASDKEAAKAVLKEQAAEKAKRGKIAEEKAAKREKPKVGRPAKPPTPTPTAPETVTEPESDINVCTKNEAYQDCHARLVEPGIATIDNLNNTWLTTIESLGGEEALDGEGWASVRNIVLDELREVPV